MVAAARRYGRVVSGGSQRVLGDYRKVVDPCWSGELGTDQVDQRQRRPAPAALQPGGPADARRVRLGHVARPRAVGSPTTLPLQRQLFDQRQELAVVQATIPAAA
jgi:hypothetical protein